jgi:hypothetical protein
MKAIRQVFAIILISAGLFGFIRLATSQSSKSPADVLQKLWMIDIDQIKSEIPQLYSIKEIEFNFDDENTKVWAQKMKAPIPVLSSGEYKLEILLMLQNQELPIRAIIQHHIIQISTGNSVFEFSRSYELSPQI